MNDKVALIGLLNTEAMGARGSRWLIARGNECCLVEGLPNILKQRKKLEGDGIEVLTIDTNTARAFLASWLGY